MNQPETITIKVVNSPSNEYYFTIMIDDMGCVEICAITHGETKPHQKFIIAPEEAFAVADAMKFVAQEELNISGF